MRGTHAGAIEHHPQRFAIEEDEERAQRRSTRPSPLAGEGPGVRGKHPGAIEHRARPGPFRSILRETPACTHTGNAGGSSDHARIVPHPRVS